MQTCRSSLWRCAAIASVALAACIIAPRADACSCVGSRPPCEQYWEVAAVFAGRVTSIEPVPQAVPPSSATRVLVHFDVTDGFRGVSRPEVVVGTGQGGGDCGYKFEVGTAYFVYAYGAADGRLTTGICTRTKRLSTAAEDLEYARALRAGAAPGALVFGIVRDGNSAGARGGGYDPLGGIAIVLSGDNGTFRAVSDASGKFQISGLPAGRYDARVETRDDQYAEFFPTVVQLRDPRGCATFNAVVRHDGRIGGRIVDGTGEPVPFVGVELWQADYVTNAIHRIRPEGTARTDADGQFTFTRVPPGRYIVGASPRREIGGRTASPGPAVFLPGVADAAAATVIEIGLEAPVRLPELIWPSAIRLVTIRGRVLDEYGAPAVGAKIYVRGDTKLNPLVGEPATTDGEGRFALALLAGERYSLTAELRTPDNTTSLWSGGDVPAFTAGEQTTSLTIVIRPVPLTHGPGQ